MQAGDIKMSKKRVAALFIIAFLSLGILLNANYSVAQENTTANKATVKFLVNYIDYYGAYDNLNIVEKYKKFRPDVNLVVDSKNIPIQNLGDALKDYDVALVPAFDNVIHDNYRNLAVLNKLKSVKENKYAEYTAIGGNIYGIPCTSALELVWYRKSIFNEYNLTVPRTWAEFISSAKKIKDGSKYIPIALNKGDHWPRIMFTRSLFSLEYGNSTVWNRMLGDAAPFSKGKPIYKGLEKLKSLVDGNFLSMGSELSILNESVDLFTGKKAAMLCWREYLKDDFWDEDIGCFFLPVREKENDALNVTANIDAYLIESKYASNKAEADAFIEWHQGAEWYQPFISQRGYTSTQKNIQTDYLPKIQEAFSSAGPAINFVTPSLAGSDFYKRLSNSRISFLDIAADLLAGRSVADLAQNLNRQWKLAANSGREINIKPENVGQYALAKENSQKYIRPEIDYNYKGPDVVSSPDINSCIDDSLILHTDYPYAYAYTVKNRMDPAKPELKPVIADQCVLVPIRFIQDAFGAQIDAKNPAKIKMTYLRQSCELSTGNSTMKMGKQTYKLGSSPRLIKGNLYVPLDGLVQNFFKMSLLTNNTIAIVCKEENIPGSSPKEWLFDRATTVFKSEGLLRITVDPRVELLKIVEILCRNGNDRITRYDSKYRSEVVKYFLPYVNHPSIRQLRESGFGGSTSMLSIMMHLAPPPSLAVEAPFGDELESNGLQKKTVDGYIEAMRIFARDTNFMNFYDKNYKIYRQITQKAEKESQEGRYIRHLTDYYGTRLPSYNTILAPLLAMVSVGPHVEWEKGRLDTYNIVSSLRPENGIPYFGSKERLREIIWHEFGHSYVNGLTKSKWSELSKYSKLANNAKMPQNYGGNWEICINEHIIRAVTARLILKVSGKEAYDFAITAQKNEGFVYIEDICNSLESYEKNRAKYTTFAEFYPEIIKVFRDQYKKLQTGVIHKNINGIIPGYILFQAAIQNP